MKRRNSITAGIWLLAFALLALWRILSLPRYPDRLFRSIPESATLAFYARNAAADWDSHLKNPIVTELSRSIGFGDLHALADDRVIGSLVAWLGDGPVAAAWSPAGTDAERPYGSAVTELSGIRAATVRFLLWVRYFPGIGRLHVTDNGIRYIRFHDEADGSSTLALGMLDGTLMAAYGDRPSRLDPMRRRFLYGAAPAPVFGGDRPWEEEASASLSMWIADEYGRSYLRRSNGTRVDVSSVSSRELSLLIHFRGAFLPWKTPDRKKDGVETLVAGIPSNAAAAVLVVPGELLGWAAETWEFLPEDPEGYAASEWAVLNLSVKPYEGRLMGIAVPALFLRWRRERPFEPARVDAWLDRLNRMAHLGLIRRAMEKKTNGREMLIDTSLLGSGLSGREDQCGVVAWHAGTAVLGTSGGSLRRQFKAGGGRGAMAEFGRWMDDKTACSAVLAGGAISCDAAASALRDTVAVYRLMRLMGAAGDADINPSVLIKTAEVLETLDRFGPIRAVVQEHPMRGLTVALTFGTAAEPR